MINLDTHILVHAIEGNVSLKERKLLSAHAWGISSIVVWELAKLVQLKRLELDLDSAPFRAMMTRVYVWPIDMAVARASTQLDFRSDPADEIIAATSVVFQVPLLTRDRKILRSKVVPFA